jgi:agmatinase
MPACTQLNDLDADIAIIGLHYISPYPRRSSAIAAETTPDAIRRQSSRFIDDLDNYNFDFNDVLLAAQKIGWWIAGM